MRLKDLPVWRVIVIGTVFFMLFNLAWLVPALTDIREKALAHQLEVAEKVSIEFQRLVLDHPKERVNEFALFLLSNLTDNITFDTIDRERAAQFFQGRDDVRELFAFDGSGRERLRVSRAAQFGPESLRDLSREEYFREAAYSGFAATMLHGEDRTTHFVLVVKRYETQELGIFFLAAVVDVSGIRSFAPSLLSNEKEFVYVTDTEGVAITHYEPSLAGAVAPSHNLVAELFAEQAGGEEGESRFGSYVDEEGKKFQAAVLVLEPLDLAVVAEDPYQAVWGSWNRFLFFIILSFGFFIALVVFLTRNTLSMVRYSRELSAARDRIGSIVTHLDTGIIEHDGDFKILLVNPRAEELLGFTREDVLDRVVTADITQQFPRLASLAQVLYPVLADSLRKIQKKEKEGFDTIEMKIKYPAEADLEVTTIPLADAAGAPGSFLRVVRDVSREKAIARSKSEFISVAAHQLRTPLSAIKWVFKMLLEGDAGAISDEQKDFLQKGYLSNERMIQLVTDMLDVARIEEGRYGFSFYFVNLPEVVKKTVDTFQMRAQERGVTLTFRSEKLAPVKLDPARIEMVMQNLIDNALKYTPEGGTVSVSVRRIGDHAEVSVSDSGIGVPQDQADKLFTKFFRGTNAVKRQTEGTGLGLFIVRNIIERHGGTVWAEANTDGPGTTFRFVLSLVASAVPTPDGRAEEFVQGL